MFQLWFGGFSREGGEGGRRQPCRGEDFINSDRFIFQTFFMDHISLHHRFCGTENL